MTAKPLIDPEQFLHGQLAQASPDLLRERRETFVIALLSAQADSVCGDGGYGVRSPEGANRRKGAGTGTSTPGWAPWMWRCPRFARAASSRTG